MEFVKSGVSIKNASSRSSESWSSRPWSSSKQIREIVCCSTLPKMALIVMSE